MSRYTDSHDEGARFSGAVCVRESDGAVLIEHEDFDEQTWIPKSCLHDDSEVYRDGDEGDLVIVSWWAAKNGLA